MGTEDGVKREAPRRRLVMLVEPAPDPDCGVCRGEGVVEYEADGDPVEDTCHCCRPEHRDPTVDDLVEHLKAADAVVRDQVRERIGASAAAPSLGRVS